MENATISLEVRLASYVRTLTVRVTIIQQATLDQIVIMSTKATATRLSMCSLSEGVANNHQGQGNFLTMENPWLFLYNFYNDILDRYCTTIGYENL